MSHNLACVLKNQMSALENWRDSNDRMPNSSEEAEVLAWAEGYLEWNCLCDEPFRNRY